MSKIRMFHNILNFILFSFTKILFFEIKIKIKNAEILKKIENCIIAYSVEGAIMVLQNGLVFSSSMWGGRGVRTATQRQAWNHGDTHQAHTNKHMLHVLLRRW
jgi:hypothetical protein